MTDQEAIQGDWVSVAPSMPGYQIPIGPDLIGSKLRYQLRPDSIPKQIFIEHRDAEGRTHSSAHGLYELSGDLLTVRWAYSDRLPPESLKIIDRGDSILHLRRVI